MTRKEHLDWCKGRALEYVDNDELPSAISSMISDLYKFDGQPMYDHAVMMTLSQDGMMVALKGDANAVRHWIEGFG